MACAKDNEEKQQIKVKLINQIDFLQSSFND